jgi:DNA-binding NtrC family response regulator
MAEGRVLLVATDEAVIGACRSVLASEGYAVAACGSAAQALAEVERTEWDAVLVDLGVPDAEGPEILKKLKARRAGLAAVAIADSGAAGWAARDAGAYAFLERPGDLAREKILTLVANALEHRALAARVAALERAVPATLKLEERERQAILQALETTRWNKQAAAGLLGLHRPTLYSKMRKHGIPQKRPT